MEESDIPETEINLEEKLQDYMKKQCEMIVESEMRKYAEGYFKSMVLPRMIKEVRENFHQKLISKRGMFKFEIYYGESEPK